MTQVTMSPQIVTVKNPSRTARTKRNPLPRVPKRVYEREDGSSGSSDSLRAYRTRTPVSRTRAASSSSLYAGNDGKSESPIHTASYSRSQSRCSTEDETSSASNIPPDDKIDSWSASRRAETASDTRRSSSSTKRQPVSRNGQSRTRSISRLRNFEAKRQKLKVFSARCFSESPVKRRLSDDFSDVEDADYEYTINVFESTNRKKMGEDTIRFSSHIKYTCELFDKHMTDQYAPSDENEGKKVDGIQVYNYWLFYQQVERFREIGLELLQDSLQSNDKKMLRDCIDEIKQEVKLVHSMFLDYDSPHCIHIEDKRIMGTYSLLFERCGRFARLTKGGNIKPHETITIFDEMQQYAVKEFLEPLFIDFCYFMQLQFIIPQKEAYSPRIEIAGPCHEV